MDLDCVQIIIKDIWKEMMVYCIYQQIGFFRFNAIFQSYDSNDSISQIV